MGRFLEAERETWYFGGGSSIEMGAGVYFVVFLVGFVLEDLGFVAGVVGVDF